MFRVGPSFAASTRPAQKLRRLVTSNARLLPHDERVSWINDSVICVQLREDLHALAQMRSNHHQAPDPKRSKLCVGHIDE